MGHTVVSDNESSSVTLKPGEKSQRKNAVILNIFTRESIYMYSLLANRPVCALISHVDVGPVHNLDWYEFQNGDESQHIWLQVLKRKGYTLVK